MMFIPRYEKKHLTGALDILWSSSDSRTFQASPKGRSVNGSTFDLRISMSIYGAEIIVFGSLHINMTDTHTVMGMSESMEGFDHRNVAFTSDVLTRVCTGHLKIQDTQTPSGLSHHRRSQLEELAL